MLVYVLKKLTFIFLSLTELGYKDVPVTADNHRIYQS